MKPCTRFLFINVATCFILLLAFAAGSLAQTPQYYNANSAGISNTLPFGSSAVTGYKTQHLIGPGEYIQPSPAPAGNITQLYIYMATTGGGTYTNLTIKMGQTAITTFPTGTYSGQLDTVYYRASGVLSSTSNAWMVVTLDRAFSYDPAQSLVIEISHCGFTGSGMSVFQSAGTAGIIRRNTHSGTTSCVFTYSGQDTRILQCGVDVASNTGPPQYYNYNTTGGTNSFPFNIPLGKQIQVLFLPGDFAQPSPAPAGNITSVSFRLAANLGPYTYSNMVIKMGQTDLTTFATGVWYAGQLDTVYYRASVTLGGLANEWVSISLDRPFAYNPARSLVIDVQQCGAPGATGFSSGYTSLAGFRRNVSPVGASCPLPWGGQNGYVHHMGVNIVPGTTYNVPELLYYTFENSAPGLTPNTASAPVGTNPSPITGHTLGTGGMVDTCLVGAAGTGANCVLPGWNWNVTGPWTIGFWVSNLLETAAGSPTYLFGDPGSGSFRCFYGGAALPNNIIFRGPFNATGWTVNVPMPGSYYIHLVWDGSAIVIYKNGVLVSTNHATNVMPTGTGFKFAGYSTSSYSLNVGGLMDEFRLYSRALDALEIQRTWNHTLPYIFTTSVEPPSQEIPVAYELAQNYPNPFNPTTTIQYGLPAAANVTLKIYNILGQEIITLVDEQKNPGTYQTIWNSRNSAGAQVASGVYIYSLVARSASNATTYTNIKKMLFLK
jgi:hypothetical protein